MTDLLAEARRMPVASVAFAKGVSRVWTPDHLVPLRTLVRDQHGAELAAVHNELYKRFDRTGEDYLNVLRAAAEMAVMEHAGRAGLSPEDRRTLRQLWVQLLAAE